MGTYREFSAETPHEESQERADYIQRPEPRRGVEQPEPCVAFRTPSGHAEQALSKRGRLRENHVKNIKTTSWGPHF
ncbi:hypothetical protein CU044_1340 [Streptomyces sp. L-9-10]|nr:hypothetical protein CU044_1340 [Streptomyces sp. L-9-10]